MAAVENPDGHQPAGLVACDFPGWAQFRGIKPMSSALNIGSPAFGARQGRMGVVLSYYARVVR
jgi:hypothetical protein